MNITEIVITRELASHFDCVEGLSAAAFGPGRFARTAFRLREGVDCEPGLSFVALKGGRLVGSVRVTRILIGGKPALVLGPLVVVCEHKNQGIGGKLMWASVEACKKTSFELIILVGDLPYYKPFDFKEMPHGKIMLPGPVNPQRLLYCELKRDGLSNFNGVARPSFGI